MFSRSLLSIYAGYTFLFSYINWPVSGHVHCDTFEPFDLWQG